MGLALKVSANGSVVQSAIEVFYSQVGECVHVWTYDGDGQVKVYRNGSLLLTADVSGWPHYQAGGAVGVWIVDAEAARLDDFGGGNAPLGRAPVPPDRLAFAGGVSLPRIAFLAGLGDWWQEVFDSLRGWWERLWGSEDVTESDTIAGEGLRLQREETQLHSPSSMGEVWRSYYYAGSVRVAVRKTTQTTSVVSYLLTDHLGSTIVAVTGTSVTGSRRYTAWGQTRDATGSLPTSYQYTGQYHQEALGIYYYGARWFDPYLNRWLQPDSIIPDPYNSLDWDRYSYSRNNPIRYSDPTGHSATDDCGPDNINCGGLIDPIFPVTPAVVLGPLGEKLKRGYEMLVNTPGYWNDFGESDFTVEDFFGLFSGILVK
jgi:RHS repeat-associated protein